MIGLLGPYPTKTIYHINNDRVQGSYPANNLFEIDIIYFINNDRGAGILSYIYKIYHNNNDRGTGIIFYK